MNTSIVQDLIDQLWDFDNPTASEAHFRTAADQTTDGADRLELLTQVARAQGLQHNVNAAHRTLDQAQLSNAPERASGVVAVRCLLERGRLFNSAHQRDLALPCFEDAFTAAAALHNDHLAIDAAHMMAIVHGSQNRLDLAMEWNQRALRMAEESTQPRARQWRGSLHNNIGWTLHDQGDFPAALSHFEKALACRLEQNKPSDIRIARWCIGRCLRSLNRVDEALTIQAGLLGEQSRNSEEPDGFVHEEYAECLCALGRLDEARPHFAAASQLLGRNSTFAAQQPDRLRRLLDWGQEIGPEQPHQI